jgi:hypothetical protein
MLRLLLIEVVRGISRDSARFLSGEGRLAHNNIFDEEENYAAYPSLRSSWD